MDCLVQNSNWRNKLQVSETIKMVLKAVSISGSQQSLANSLKVTRQMVSRWSLGGGMSLSHYLAIKEYIERNGVKK